MLLDESFLDFVEQELPSHSQGVIRLRSMTKFYAIAGIRLGYILADEFLIKKMIKQKEPWSVNAFAQGIVPKLLADHAFKDDTYKLIREQRELLLRGLQSLGLRDRSRMRTFSSSGVKKMVFTQRCWRRDSISEAVKIFTL